MELKGILDYQLLSTPKFEMTVYNLVISVITVIIAIILLRLLKSFFRRLVGKNKIESGPATSIFKILKYLIWVITISMLLPNFGVSITVLIAGSTALFVGLGFGLQNLFTDFISGLIILFERSLKVSDVVELDDGTVGQVLDISLRVSEIKNRDNITVIVPNSKLVNENVINWSHIDKITRFCIKVGVAYGSDVNMVQKLLEESVFVSSKVEKTPSPFARFNNFGDSSLDFEIFFWTYESFDAENIKSDIRFEINRLFNENNVTIAFPQLDVHLQK